MTERNLYLVVSVDIDEDSFDKNLFPGSHGVTWKGVDEGVPKILQSLKGYRDSSGEQIKYTWFVRCDKQLENLYGDPAYLFKRFQVIWKESKTRGDEIAWHFHAYDHEPNIVNNEKQLVKDLKECFLSSKSDSLNISASRVGRAFCSNGIIEALDEVGLKVDSTALPGRERKDELNSLDWEITPQLPFFPSLNDYRVPGNEHVDLLEVPMSMIETMAPYDSHPIKRYANLTFKNSIIGESLCKYIKENDLLVTIMHPSELIPQREHPLLSFNVNEVRKNLDTIQLECERIGKSIKFITITEVLNLLEHGLINLARG